MNKTTSSHADVITLPPLVYLAGLLLGLLIHYFSPVRFLEESVSTWVGILLILVSMTIGLLALLAFQRAGTSPHLHKPTTAIVTDGIYQLSRNPMYVSLSVFYLGLACWINSLWILLLIVPVLMVVEWGIIKREEQYLEQKFGDEYLRYKSQVRRWI